MAETIRRIVIKSDEWVSLNQEARIPIGTAFTISNVGMGEVRLVEATDEPMEQPYQSGRGDILTTMAFPYAQKLAIAGSLEIWAASNHLDVEAVLSVQLA